MRPPNHRSETPECRLVRAAEHSLKACYWLVIGLFLASVINLFDRDTGFTRLIVIGDKQDIRAVSSLKTSPHYVYPQSEGYNGAYYVQLALNPSLNNPELLQALDNPPYRARRIFPSWAAWLLGLGQPHWIIQAYACLNILCWFALAWLLWKWLPPTNVHHLVKWTGVMLSAGVCISVRRSVNDLPALLLVGAAVWLIQSGKKAGSLVAFAASILTKETSVISAGAVIGQPPWRPQSQWSRFIRDSFIVTLPLVLWMVYVHWRLPTSGEAGVNNFTLPFSGWAWKVQDAFSYWLMYPTKPSAIANCLIFVSSTAQAAYFLPRWQPTQLWWRVGLANTLLMFFLGIAVWEGRPGAFARVLLPMTLAFNLTIPNSRRWFPLLVVGNLSLPACLIRLALFP